MERIELRQIRIYGIVQGVGFRPTVDRHAHTAGVTGTVSNRGSYVEINAEGTAEQLDLFLHLIREQSPERAVILKMDVKPLGTGWGQTPTCPQGSGGTGEGLTPTCPRRYKDFRIVGSEKTSGEIFISPDIAICDTCRRELFDKRSRRYLHPFINCTSCGPRFSLLEALPYDRERTSMKKFPMCGDCSREYHDPRSRFYDAQPVCCPNCGPEVYLTETGSPEDISLRGRSAITRARQILCGGGIIAVKGIGGFHLACDAASREAVMRLRRLKKRPMKPFAVMAKDEGTADRECIIPDAQRAIMNGHQKPILLLEKRPGGRICDAAAPDIPTVGLMLPYAPVQLLLFTYDDEWQRKMPDVLVMTSGNASGAPIASTDREAAEEIAGFCDAILSNDRDIRIRTDDSVMDFYDGGPYMIRRSRGYAPLPFIVSGGGPSSGNGSPEALNTGGGGAVSDGFRGKVLGIGGELKNTFCLGKNDIFYPSAYVGDLADVRTVRALEDAVRKTETLLEMEPEIVAADLHPKYNSGLVAEKIAGEKHIPLVRLQHHYAHVLSCMAENDYTEGKVIGVSFDGTGYGTDGTIWGGEFLLSDLDGFERCGYIRPFLQIGGDLSAREGWRIAVSMIYGLFGEEAAKIIGQLGLCDASAAKVQKVLFDRRINAVQSTSAGRLFDAISAILGIRKVSTFEGEAATALMYRAMEGRRKLNSGSGETDKDHIDESIYIDMEDIISTDDDMKKHILPTDVLVSKLTKAKLAGADRDILAYLFHRRLAEMIVDAAEQISRSAGVKTAALTGGVFQNRLLLKLTEKGLKERHLKVLRHHLVPPNDGGIALGQALYAMRYLQTHKGPGTED